MIAKEIVLDILKNIETDLYKDNEMIGLNTIRTYKKNIQIATNEKIKKLVSRQKKIMERYGEDSKLLIIINKKIDKELQKIFNT